MYFYVSLVNILKKCKYDKRFLKHIDLMYFKLIFQSALLLKWNVINIVLFASIIYIYIYAGIYTFKI